MHQTCTGMASLLIALVLLAASSAAQPVPAISSPPTAGRADTIFALTAAGFPGDWAGGTLHVSIGTPSAPEQWST